MNDRIPVQMWRIPEASKAYRIADTVMHGAMVVALIAMCLTLIFGLLRLDCPDCNCVDKTAIDDGDFVSTSGMQEG